MYCVIQEVRRKKQDRFGEPLEIVAYPLEVSINGVPQVPIWRWKYSEERHDRPHLEAYKITLHQSYREGGVVRKRQYSVCTMSYYNICESWWGDCIVGGEKALAEKVGIDAAELYEIIERKLEPLRERLEADFHQSAEYITRQKHEQIIADHMTAQGKFCSKYNVDKDEYARCYDVFGVLRNKEHLKRIQAEHKARKQTEREARSSYWEQWRSTYERAGGGGYSAPSASTYTEAETAILKKFYRSLSKTYHPDLNHGRDTTAEMQLLNKLKEAWGV